MLNSFLGSRNGGGYQIATISEIRLVYLCGFSNSLPPEPRCPAFNFSKNSCEHALCSQM